MVTRKERADFRPSEVTASQSSGIRSGASGELARARVPSTFPRTRANVGAAERLASGLLGGWMVSKALRKVASLRASGAILGIAGGTLLKRAVTGRSRLYERLDVDPADSRKLSHPLDRRIRLHESIEVERPAADAYRLWRDIAEHSRFVPRVRRVRASDAWKSHWVVRGILGRTVEWDALITEDLPDETIAWRTLPFSDFEHRGRVRFVPLGSEASRIDVDVDCLLPGGAVGALIARLTGCDPRAALRGALRRFRTLLELESPSRERNEGATRGEEDRPDASEVVEHASWESFPASDPPSWSRRET